ncbi:MAG TPA: endonuclease III [Deltaproteobacteria bacterium]|nr:endonuclease III [Deltaproteobacteria bacterium]HQJ08118.1 endonuclease III [Deltaproteobacteria bacterium]
MMSSGKRPFDIDLVMSLVREAVRPFPKAALFQLADEGFNSAFEQLMACILSTRTLDEISLRCSRDLFRLGRTPGEIARYEPESIDEVISSCRFHETKSQDISEIARRIVREYGGTLPCEDTILMSFRGVGRKCTNLVLGIACGQTCITVDVHVHRITNRWGYVHTKSPEQTLAALETILPKKYWVGINRILVPFGKHICTPRLPKCSTCPVLDMCRQVGVGSHR